MSTVPAGFVKPCCYFNDVIQTEEKEKMRVDRHDYKDIWNSPAMKRTRMDMATGKKVAGCQQCYREESHGKTSMRLRSLSEWGVKPHITELVADTLIENGHAKHLPKILELKPGNLCNLKCRMCNKFDSNLIGRELIEISKYRPDINPKNYDRIKSNLIYDQDFDVEDMVNWSDLGSFWENVRENIASLEFLGFAGGESALIKEVNDTIKYCVDSGHAHHINVFYTTNLTKINKETFKLAKQFRTFTWIASIDGIGPTQEYIRFPSDWKTVEKNFIRLKEHIDADQWRVIANFTVQLYNICNLSEFLDWIEKLNQQSPAFVYNPVSLNLLTYPEFLDIQNAPVEVRQRASELLDSFSKRTKLHAFDGFTERLAMIQSILHRAPADKHKEWMDDFIHFTRILDRHRKQDLRLTDPLLFRAASHALDSNAAESQPSNDDGADSSKFSLVAVPSNSNQISSYRTGPGDWVKGSLRFLASIIKLK